MVRPAVLYALLASFLSLSPAQAAITVFFDPSQVAIPITSGTTSDTIGSNGYLFTYTRDKLFTGGIGPDPIGRPVSVNWPDGIDAQAVTAGPNPASAQVTISRADGTPFDILSWTAKLLANTAAAGASFEIMPTLAGQDGFADPLALDCTGIAGNSFSYSTPTLRQFDTYHITLFCDYAITGLTLQGAPVPEPASLALLAAGSLLLLRRRR